MNPVLLIVIKGFLGSSDSLTGGYDDFAFAWNSQVGVEKVLEVPSSPALTLIKVCRRKTAGNHMTAPFFDIVVYLVL